MNASAAVPHLIGYLLPLAIVICAQHGGAWLLVPVALLFVGAPVVDALGGRDGHVRTGYELAAYGNNPWFRLVTWGWVPVQVALLGWAVAWAVAAPRTPIELVGLVLSLGGTTGAIGITFAHELVHRTSAFERTLGEILLIPVAYTHFAIEHVSGHHRHVGTPLDPATARYGESFYRFLPRTVFGGIGGAWRFEAARLRRRGRDTWHPSNRMLRYAAEQLVLYAVTWRVGGPIGVMLLAAQALVAVSLLEAINYVEHYGLTRRELAPGAFERLSARHSWDSSYRLTNWMFINLARHADHHLTTSKRYQTLDNLDQAPELPAGYGMMFVLALVPPLWFAVMNPRVEAWRRARPG